MEKTFIWKQDNSGKLISEDGYITVYQRDKFWVMVDLLDDDEVQHSSQNECLDEAGKRIMITELGGFNAFLGVMKRENDLIFDHFIVEYET